MDSNRTNKVEKFFDIKISLVFLIYSALALFLISFIPQDAPELLSYSRYPARLANLIIKLKLHEFFDSLLFFIPALLFLLHSIYALIAHELKMRREKIKDLRRFGTDLVYLSFIFILAVGLFYYFPGKSEEIKLKHLQKTKSSSGMVFYLKKAEKIEWTNGDLKEVEAQILVQEKAGAPSHSLKTTVNKAAVYKDWTIYVTGWEQKSDLLISTDGEVKRIKEGATLKTNEDTIEVKYAGIREMPPYGLAATMQIWNNGKLNHSLLIKEGEGFYNHRLNNFFTRTHCKIKIRKEPPLNLFWVFIGILALGCFLILFSSNPSDDEEQDNV